MTELTDEQMLNVTGGFANSTIFEECVTSQMNKKGSTEAEAIAVCCKQPGLSDIRCNNAAPISLN